VSFCRFLVNAETPILIGVRPEFKLPETLSLVPELAGTGTGFEFPEIQGFRIGRIFDGSGNRQARPDPVIRTVGEAEKIGKEIVFRWNSHQKLVEALEKIREFGRINTGCGFSCSRMAGEALALLNPE